MTFMNCDQLRELIRACEDDLGFEEDWYLVDRHVNKAVSAPVELVQGGNSEPRALGAINT